MKCNDPILNFLKSYGYNVVRLPKADINPLEMLTRNGKDLDKLGSLPTVLLQGQNIKLPNVKRDIPVSNISGEKTSDVSIGLGVSILGNIIGAMGGSKLGLDVKYKKAKTVSFEFNDVLEDKIEIAELDQFLSDADVSPYSQYVAQLMEADDLYVITSVIKSNSITVEAKRNSDTGIDLSVPEIKEIIGGNVDVSAKASSSSKISFTGKIPLVFGFQAIRLEYKNGVYKSIQHITNNVGMKSIQEMANEVESENYYSTESSFVNF